MPKSDNQKLMIFYILDYLNQNSHEKHPIRAAELIEMLQNQHNISCDRKTVYSDIAALQDYGVDIVSLPGKNGGYFIQQRNFELPELKLLIDAVQSSRFLTEKKSRELIEKLCNECSVHDARLMRRDVLVSGRVKNMNETIYYSVDTIQEAISQNRQIQFRYFDWGIDGQRHYREKLYIASPYSLCQDNENYYLLAFSERYGVTSYRVDRMAEIELLEEVRVPCLELTGNALNQHANRLFQMYQGQESDVKLRFHRRLVNAVIDKFSRDILLIPDGEDHFVFTVKVAVSPMFLSWVVGFGKDAQILHPQSVIEQCRQMCLEALGHYPSKA